MRKDVPVAGCIAPKPLLQWQVKKRIGVKYLEIDSIPLLPKGNPEVCVWSFPGYDIEDSDYPNDNTQK